MLILGQIIVFLLLLAGLAFLGVTMWVWISSVSAALLIAIFLLGTPWWLVGPVGFVFIMLALLFAVPGLRFAFLTQPAYRYLKKTMPPMRKTEKEALQAGNAWIERDLFQGKPAWSVWQTWSLPRLSAEEQSFLDNEVEALCDMVNEWDNMHEGLSESVWDYIKENGFLGMIIPEQYGGKEFSPAAHSAVITKLATRSASTAISVMVPNSLGPAEMLLHYGTEQQKDYYLPRLAKGEDIPCFALTGLEAGSDASAIQDTGIVCQQEIDGKIVLAIRLVWRKRYITLAPIATLLGLAFQLRDPQRLLGGETNIGITLALIPTSHPGVNVGKRHAPMNLPFMNGPTEGNDVVIPLEWVIGGQENLGKGWQMMMESLANGRGLSLPAMSTGAAKLCYRTTGAYARVRKQFSQSIGYFEGVSERLARIGGYTYMLEATRLFTLSALEQGVKPAVASAIAKYHMTEMARVIVNDAMDVHGGRAVQYGPRNYLSSVYQAAPITITVEGANILTRSLIIFGQGALRCHPLIHAELLAADNDTNDIEAFDRLMREHMSYSLANVVRCFVYAITAGRVASYPKKTVVSKYYRQLTRMSVALALIADVALVTLGGSLKRREALSARLGDVLSHLYMGTAVLKYFEDNQRTYEDIPYVVWSLQTCLYAIQQALLDFLANFPHRGIAWCCRVLIFPFGARYKKPKDVLAKQVAGRLLEPSNFRDRLTSHCYVGTDPADPVCRMDNALAQLVRAKAADKKLHQAICSGDLPRSGNYKEKLTLALKASILSPEEIKMLAESELTRLDAIEVDQF